MRSWQLWRTLSPTRRWPWRWFACNPVPDGYSLMFYKTIGELLIPHFLKAYNEAEEGVNPPEDKLRAYITVIPKEGKDPLLCQNYQPISLLKVHLKIFIKILSLCLIDLIPQPSGVRPHEGGTRQHYKGD